MRHTNGLITVNEALRRVFLPTVSNTARQCYRSCQRPIPSSLQSLRQWPASPAQLQKVRHASTSSMGGNMTFVDNGENQRKRPDRPPRDEEITDFKVYLVHPERKGLSEPIPTYEVLQSRQKDEKGRPTQFLQQMAPMSPQDGRPYPICRLFDKKAAREAEIAKRKSGKEKKLQSKQLEVSWTVSENDLNYRLERLKEFLGKGWRVEIIFGAKRKGWMGKREPTAEEVQKVLTTIRAAVKEIEGAREWRELQGNEGGEAVLSFERKPKK